MAVHEAERAAARARRSFGSRFLGAFRFDVSVYEEVKHDPRALPQAALVVGAGGFARGLGAFPEEGWVGLVGSIAAAAVIWFTAAAAVAAIGARALRCSSSFDELLRTLGFAAAPLCLLAIGVLPLGVLRTVISIVGHGLATAALVLAVRQALDVDTRRALIVCACALGLGVGLLLILGILLLSWPAS